MKQTKKLPDAGDGAGSRTVRVVDVMTRAVHTVTRHQTLGQLRDLLADRGIHSAPVVDEKGNPVGMVTSTDLLAGRDERTLIGRIMNREVYTVPQYAAVHEAARIMRNHHIHHVVVTHDKKMVGLLSSFDLLQLVEDRRFRLKNPPTRDGKAGKRKKQERDGHAGTKKGGSKRT